MLGQGNLLFTLVGTCKVEDVAEVRVFYSGLDIMTPDS